MISSPDTLLNALANDYRRVASQWRALIYLRRATKELSPDERRWINTPSNTKDMAKLFRRMVRSGQIESIPSAPGCYAAVVPYARRLGMSEQEVLFELNPYAVISHYSALEYHSFTYDQPKIMTISVGTISPSQILGTTEDEWEGIALPTAHRPTRVVSCRIMWFLNRTDQSFGIICEPNGRTAVRVSDRERTLIESLQWPNYSGGIANVIRAWDIAQDFVDIDKIVDYTERFGIKVLRQRVGFVAEEIGYRHPQFDLWAETSIRGSSNKLVGTEPVSSTYSGRWNLSINAPVRENIGL